MEDYTRTKMKWNGWGWEGKTFDYGDSEEDFWKFFMVETNIKILPETPSVGIEEISLPPKHINKTQLKPLVDLLGKDRVKTDRFERVFHCKSHSFTDLSNLRNGIIEVAPDVIVYPKTNEEVETILNYAQDHNYALIPYGGGTSVVGGINSVKSDHKGIITLDTSLMNQLLELNETSQTATFQAGIYGPNLEEILEAKGYKVGHTPQSFEFSTLGGWIAARGAGAQSGKYGLFKYL